MPLALVTGGAGFVGHGVVGALHRAGWAVRVLDPAPPHPTWPRGIDHRSSSLLDADSLRDAAVGVDAVFHVAGLWDGRPGGDARMRAINVDGTRAVLGLGRPVVYTSSSITCGFGPRHAPGSEDGESDDPRRPLRGTGRVYRETKLAAERMVAEAGGWIVNPDYVVGAGDVGRVVTGPLLRVAALPVIPAPTGGKCFVGVHDVGDGHLAALEVGKPSRRYLLGAENLAYAEVFLTVAGLMGRRARVVPLPHLVARLARRLPLVGPTGGALEQMGVDRYRDATRARSELGWSPRPVREALAEMVREHQRQRPEPG